MPRLLPLVIAVFAAAPAIADGFYVAADLGISSYDDTVRTDVSGFSDASGTPDSLPMNGQPFDSNETAWGVAVGWQARDWLAIELGFTDLGNSGQDTSAPFFGPILIPNDPIFLPGPPPNPNFDPNDYVATGFPAFPGRAALDVEEWSLSARFKRQLGDQFSANWLVGVTRADYAAEGTFPVTEIDTTLFPPDVTIVEVPYAAPDAETGLLWGLGFGWQATASTSVEITYRQHKTDVIDIDTTSLRLLFAF